MVTKLAVPSVVFVAALVSLGAQSARPTPALPPSVKLQAGETAVPGECLSKEELDLNQRLQALTRPTRGVEAGQESDDPLRFNPNYLVGKWTVDGVVPESPDVLSASNAGTPVILNETSDAASAYDDAVARLLGESKPLRFTEEPRKGFFARMFGG